MYLLTNQKVGKARFLYATYKRIYSTIYMLTLFWMMNVLNSKLFYQVLHIVDVFLGYPCSLLKPDTKKVFNKSLRACSTDMLSIFLEEVVQAVLKELTNGK